MSCVSHRCGLCTVFEISSQTDFWPLRDCPFRRIFPSLFVWCSGAGEDDCVAFQRPLFFIVAETTSVLLLRTSPFAFQGLHSPSLPFNADKFPLTSFHQYSCFTSFASGLKVSGSDLPYISSLWSSISVFPGSEICLFSPLVCMAPIRF